MAPFAKDSGAPARFEISTSHAAAPRGALTFSHKPVGIPDPLPAYGLEIRAAGPPEFCVLFL